MEFIAWLLSILFGFAPPQTAFQGQTSRDLTIMLDPVDADRRRPLPKIWGARGSNRPLVVIDAGHGGHDPGAIAPGGEREKDVTLALARSVRDALIASGRVRVALTRDDDHFLILRDRYEIARRIKADLFVSIHADAAPNPGATGATIYTLSEVASDAEAALLATRENKADIIGGVNMGLADPGVNRILIDLAQRESMDVSAKFASLLIREASPIVPFRSVPHRFASLVVLKAPDIPSILFEAGYLTHGPDLAFIRSTDGRRRISEGMRRAIEAHFARRIAASSATRITAR